MGDDADRVSGTLRDPRKLGVRNCLELIVISRRSRHGCPYGKAQERATATPQSGRELRWLHSGRLQPAITDLVKPKQQCCPEKISGQSVTKERNGHNIALQQTIHRVRIEAVRLEPAREVGHKVENQRTRNGRESSSGPGPPLCEPLANGNAGEQAAVDDERHRVQRESEQEI